MKVGLCTAGGDCPGLNAAIRAIVKHAIGTYGMEVWGLVDSFNGLMEKPYRASKLGGSDVTEILERGGTILGTINSGSPFRFPKDGTPGCENTEKVMAGYRELGLEALIVIGGDGSQTIAGQFGQIGMNVVGVPKTIDNDQLATDVSIGFQTAVDTATDAVAKLKTTAESHDRIMVLEVMGRDAGHIALHAGIAGGADVILLPEVPFHWEPIVKKIKARKQLGRNFSIVVVAEGAFEDGGSPTFTRNTTSHYKNAQMGGIGAIVSKKLHELTEIETRTTVLGHVQRGGSPAPYDRVLASALGVYAVDLVQAGTFNVVVGVKNGQLATTPHAALISKTQPLALDSIYIKTAESIGICLGRENKFRES